ncbi:MAG: 2-dehydro-3-deoxyglucarate aldolase [Rhizobacter sp.]|nr:2-dehydro-3-deoxyglucarate aldolase [Rhizobacter sp.]
MNALKQLLQSSGGQPPVGTWVMSASPLVAEAVGCAGFDWCVIDMEHAPLDVMGVAHLLQAVASTKMLPVVRVPWNDAVVAKRVLDAGAATLMFPMVQTAGEAERAVAATRYPPEGVRSVSGMSRGSRFGTTPHHLKTAGRHIGVIVQLETPDALAQLEAIARVEGVDALFVGPANLSAAMGHLGEPHHPAVMACMGRAAQRCKSLGMPVGTMGDTPELVAQYRAAGFDFVAIASDLGLMMRAARAAIGALRTGGGEHVHLLSSGTRTGT